ncbi:MAG: DUF3466 family protein [Alteromonadaceae bacterium]|nr:DUF3466 family protein [Alteromonadaceae bacterium]
MKKYLKSILALGVTSALSLSSVNAATYQVIEKGNVDLLKHTYSQQINNAGEMVISGSDLYDFPVYFQYLTESDFDAIKNLAAATLASDRFKNVNKLVEIEDFDALKAGTPTANDLSWALSYIKSKANVFSYQQVGASIGMINLSDITEGFVIFDETIPETTTLSRSTTDYITGITNNSWVYGSGSAPFLPTVVEGSEGEQTTQWSRDFDLRGFFSPDKGATIIEVAPPESVIEFGGISAVLDMSDNQYAAGYASVGVENTTEGAACLVSNATDESSSDVCFDRININAFKWTFDINGVVMSENLGLVVVPHEDDNRTYASYAQAVNSNGVVVGYAHAWVDEKETNPSRGENRSFYAVVYKDGVVYDFTEDHTEHFDSRAYDINDEGIAVGHVTSMVNGARTTKFYYVDTNDTENMKMELPDDFFVGSSSTARAINENGLIVGEGEVETHVVDASTPRRRHGFLYDTKLDIFSDINDFLSCDSPYTIIEARDINENGEIAASAIVKVPLLDSQGLAILGDDGEELFQDVVLAVQLRKIDGEIEDCSQVEEKFERKGAGFGFISLFSLIVLGFSRRYLKLKNK